MYVSCGKTMPFALIARRLWLGSRGVSGLAVASAPRKSAGCTLGRMSAENMRISLADGQASLLTIDTLG